MENILIYWWVKKMYGIISIKENDFQFHQQFNLLQTTQPTTRRSAPESRDLGDRIAPEQQPDDRGIQRPWLTHRGLRRRASVAHNSDETVAAAVSTPTVVSTISAPGRAR